MYDVDLTKLSPFADIIPVVSSQAEEEVGVSSQTPNGWVSSLNQDVAKFNTFKVCQK